MITISGEFDDDDGEYGADYDPKDVDPENDPEISNDNDQDYDSDNATESGDEYNPFECPDYNNRDPEYNPFECPDYNNRDPEYKPFECPDYNKRDPEYNPFECPDYGNKEEIEDDGVERHTGEKQNEFLENLSGKEENIEENVEEYSEPETNQQEERVADSDSEIHEHKPEITSSVETENIGTEQSTIALQQQSQEQIPEHEPEDNVDNIELIDTEGNPSKSVESSEVLNIRKELEEMNLPPELENEPLNEHMLESVPEQEEKPDDTELIDSEGEPLKPIQNEDEEINKIILDAEKMEWKKIEFRGEYVSSHEEMEVEMLEEEMEELFNKYEEKGLEQLETSHELKQENNQEQKELEDKLEGAYTQEQEEKVNLEIERAQEQHEKEDIKESSRTKIKENKREILQEVHQNVVQEEIQEQVEKQKEQKIRERDKLFKEQYKQDTGRRPIYGGKETKGFIEWKEYLKEQEEDQKGKNEILHEKEKEIKAQTKEIRESKEEWVQYLANSIKEAEVSEEIRDQVNKLLEKFEDLRELLDKLKNKEITEEEFEKEVKEFEYILIEKRHIARPLFMNFDWFRRYYNGMIRKAGKRVAHLYISKKTREFLSYLSGRIEQLNNIGNSRENAEKFKEFLEKSFQIKEKWALLLNHLIRETPNKEISTEVKEELGAVINMFCKIRIILFNKHILEEDKEKLIQERIEKCNPRFFELFEILKRFLGAYDNYSRKWMEQSLIFEGKRTVRRLFQKLLENIKKENAIHQIINKKRRSIQNFKENLKQNLYKTTELNMNEKSKIIKIIQNENFDEENKVKLTNILSKLSIEELISLLGEDFKQYSQPYVKNRYYFNEIKKIIIFDFLDKKIIEQNKEDSDFNQYIKPEEKSKIKILHFRQKVIEILKNFLSLIDGTKEQKEFIGLKSIEILDVHIKRAESGEITIPKNANIRIIASAIIYTISISFENIPYISRRKLDSLTNIKTHDYISKYYNRYFKVLYPKIDRRKSFEDYRKELEPIIGEKEGEILGFRRKKGYVEVNLKCKCGNTWWTRPIYVTNRGTWCPKDAIKEKAENLKKYDIHFCKELAKKIGLSRTGFEGTCLSEKYENVSSKLDWECGTCLHKWSASLGSILYGETWCPKCIESIGETMCRKFFEALFFSEFPKAEKGEFSWLVNEDGNYMELDGHNKDFMIVFERHGRQHYENAFHFYRGDTEKFNKRQRDDQKRRLLCEQHGYHLIEVGFEWRNGKLHRIKFREMENLIRKICGEKGTIIPNQEKIKWREFQLNNPDKLKEMQDIAHSRNGELLSKIYFNAHTKLHWFHNICATDWWQTPTLIKGSKNRKGSWCPNCGGTKKKTIEDMHDLSQKILHGGNCLSERYFGRHTALYWGCGLCKYKFWKSPSNLTRLVYGGCPNCLSIKNMPKSHISLLYYLKLNKNIKSIQDIIVDLKYNYNKTVEIKTILERKGLIEKFKYYFENSRHGYKISLKGIRILKLYDILKDEKKE